MLLDRPVAAVSLSRVSVIQAIVVRLRRGKQTHAVTEGADSPRRTLCSRYEADSAIVVDEPLRCPGCIGWLERHAKRRR